LAAPITFHATVQSAMTQELIKLPADQLLTKFGSGGHKPGSGSAAALLGLVACKLVQTVVTLSAGREHYQGVEAQLTLANQDILDGIEPVLRSALQEDSEQFDKVITARRARDDEQDKSRKRNLADAALAELRTATEIPIRIAETCLHLADKAIVVFDLGFKAARGDSGVAISAAIAGASGAISIIYLNLTSFKGGEWAVQTRKKADELAARIAQLQSQLIERIERLQAEAIQREPPSE
jgi:formiminotetrahydrofolate cyclodeaminase